MAIFARYSNITSHDIFILFLIGLSNLEKINLSFTMVSDDGLRMLCGLSSLKSLNLDARQITDTGLANLTSTCLKLHWRLVCLSVLLYIVSKSFSNWLDLLLNTSEAWKFAIILHNFYSKIVCTGTKVNLFNGLIAFCFYFLFLLFPSIFVAFFRVYGLMWQNTSFCYYCCRFDWANWPGSLWSTHHRFWNELFEKYVVLFKFLSRVIAILQTI